MTTSILSIKGVGPAAAATLATHGFTTADELAAATAEQLSGIPGFSAARADRIRAGAIIAIEQAAQPTAGDDQAEAQGQDQEPESNDSPESKNMEGSKKDKKSKKKNKKKGKRKGKKKDKKKDKKKNKK